MKIFLPLALLLLSAFCLQAQNSDESKNNNDKIGGSLVVGGGVGFNAYKGGFAKGAVLSGHFKWLSASAYFFGVTKREKLWGQEDTITLNANGFAFTAGPGYFGKKASITAEFGVGHSKTHVVYRSNLFFSPWENYSFNSTTMCGKLQLNIYGKWVGGSILYNVNASKGLTNHCWLAGICMRVN